MYGVVEAAHLLGDGDLAGWAYGLLEPYRRLPMMASLAVACFGSVRQALGVAALTLGHPERAVEHLRAAVADNLALGHWPAATLSRWRLSRAWALLGRADRAEEAAAAATEEAARLGMRLPSYPEEPASENSGGRVVCRPRGRQWRVDFRERTVLVPSTVGMRHLAVLLDNPGREIPAADLAAGPGSAPATEPVSGQPILDEAARRNYRDRLERLAGEIEEAEDRGDDATAAALTDERDWLVAELAAATGLGGRARDFADGAERARIAVGKAIRRAIDRIGRADPVIAAELRATVHTGHRCRYTP
jgi:hypothetical protein